MMSADTRLVRLRDVVNIRIVSSLPSSANKNCLDRAIKLLFIISISLHNLRIVSGFFLLNNDDSFNAFGLLKKYFGIR
jgi:hypothetical protein